MHGSKLHVNKEIRRFLKWFRVIFFPYVHCYVISSNYEKGIYTQSQIWQSFCNGEEENRAPCHCEAWPYLYTYMASILILNLIVSCLIRGFVARLIVMMNPYWKRLAFRLWCLGFCPCQHCNLTYHHFILGVMHWAVWRLWPRLGTSECWPNIRGWPAHLVQVISIQSWPLLF